MTVKAQAESGHLLELVNQLKAGNNVLVLQNNKPVARLVLVEAEREVPENTPPLRLPAFTGPKPIDLDYSHGSIAEDLFDRS